MYWRYFNFNCHLKIQQYFWDVLEALCVGGGLYTHVFGIAQWSEISGRIFKRLKNVFGCRLYFRSMTANKKNKKTSGLISTNVFQWTLSNTLQNIKQKKKIWVTLITSLVSRSTPTCVFNEWKRIFLSKNCHFCAKAWKHKKDFSSSCFLRWRILWNVARISDSVYTGTLPDIL